MRQSLGPVFRSSAVLAGVFVVCLVGAGPLDPPAGPVAPTPGPEPRIAINAANTPGDADSLFKITQPGSYYLTGNITGVVGKHGIAIAASGVTLNLNGFDLVGVAAMGAFDGVSATVAGLKNIAVVNGSVRNWGGDGVDLRINTAFNCRVADVLAGGNTRNGISAGFGSTVANCSAQSNTITGITIEQGSTVSNCTAYQNGSTGISVSNGCTVSNCSALASTGTGISTGAGCTVSNCSAYQNTGTGITTGSGCTIADCTARINVLDGIVCSDACVIRANTCSNNGNGAGNGAGIHATGIHNRIEGNTCTGADRGISVDGAGNFIIRNTCSVNTTNWDVAAGNVCLVVQGVTSPAVLGNTGGVAPGSTDPNANFTY